MTLLTHSKINTICLYIIIVLLFQMLYKPTIVLNLMGFHGPKGIHIVESL